MSLAKEILEAVSSLAGDGDGMTPPPFFEVDKGNPPFSDRREDPNAKRKDWTELKRGVSDELLGDSAPRDMWNRDIRVIEFRDQRHLEEAMRLLAESGIGHPPVCEKGVDGKSLMFHVWKTTKTGEKQIEDAIKLLQDHGLVQDTKYYPHTRKRQKR